MLDERPADTTIWMVLFLAVSVVMIVVGAGLLAFGPPLT
jgi:hypothetical protein